MFKYPSPWQVLCGSLDRREQVPENEDGSPTLPNLVKENTTEEYVTDSGAFHIESSTDQIVSTTETLAHTNKSKISDTEPEATEKSTPILQETSINAHSDKTYVPEEQGANLPDSNSTMDRVTRRIYSSSQSLNGSQQDLTNFSEETQAIEKKDVWVSPPDRRLKVLREEERFEIRSHLPETSPTKLFVNSESDEDDDYKVKPRSHELTPEKVQELEKKRKDIIKQQGQRKSLDTEDVISISNQNIDFAGVEGQNKPNINTEQIHFESVRQQFIKLEKERNSLPIMPRPQPRQMRLNKNSLCENDQVTKEQEDSEHEPHKDECNITQEITEKDMNLNRLRKQFFKSLSVDSVNNEEQEKSAEEIEKQKESIPNPRDETPIEKEIRLALQREESLRKERGILSIGEAKEIIEISKNPVLVNMPDMLHSKRSKNRPRTSLYMQREINKEVQREADLKSEGRVAGLYDKGDSQELDERRKVFEQPDEVPVQPLQGSGARTVTKEIICNIKGDTDVVNDYDSKNWTDLDSPQPYSVRMKWKPTPLNVYRNRRLSAENILDIKSPLEKSSEKESSEETFVLRRENFHIQPLKFSLNIQDSEEEIERNNRKSYMEKYSTRLRPSLSNIIEQEIQQTLERDRELQEERRKVGLPPLTIQNDSELNTSHNGCDIHGTSSLSSNVSNTWSSAPWKSTLGNKLPSYDASTVQIFKPHDYPKFEVPELDGDRLKRHENRYAGIDPSDAVNTEIVESTRVSRHKNTMALRWEAGLYANEQGD
ncbi:mitotic interactor and substrate of PLK1 [Dendropsophus ebraccatus]|uniref:mitotic interactor and substrate of PLK1 n=1 Tax=Dendropsophus ebraccatus TaxID=150705 RepID=UPI003831BA3F